MHWNGLCCIVIAIGFHCIAFCCIVLYGIGLDWLALHCIVIVLYCNFIVSYCILLCFIVLYCITCGNCAKKCRRVPVENISVQTDAQAHASATHEKETNRQIQILRHLQKEMHSEAISHSCDTK